MFTEEQINRIALSNIIRDGDIVWLASHMLSGDELEIIHNQQALIENELSNPTLKELANNDILEKLSTTLHNHGINNHLSIAKAIIDEAKFWDSRLN